MIWYTAVDTRAVRQLFENLESTTHSLAVQFGCTREAALRVRDDGFFLTHHATERMDLRETRQKRHFSKWRGVTAAEIKASAGLEKERTRPGGDMPSRLPIAPANG